MAGDVIGLCERFQHCLIVIKLPVKCDPPVHTSTDTYSEISVIALHRIRGHDRFLGCICQQGNSPQHCVIASVSGHGAVKDFNNSGGIFRGGISLVVYSNTPGTQLSP